MNKPHISEHGIYTFHKVALFTNSYQIAKLHLFMNIFTIQYDSFQNNYLAIDAFRTF